MAEDPHIIDTDGDGKYVMLPYEEYERLKETEEEYRELKEFREAKEAGGGRGFSPYCEAPDLNSSQLSALAENWLKSLSRG